MRLLSDLGAALTRRRDTARLDEIRRTNPHITRDLGFDPLPPRPRDLQRRDVW